MERYIKFADKLSTWFGHTFAWLIMLMTFGVSYEVFVRYALRAPTPWAFDVTYIMYGTLFMMAGAYTLSQDGHVRADFLYRLWKPRTQAVVELVLYFLFFFPGILALIFAGWKYASRSWRFLEVSTMSPANIPIFQFKTVIVVAGVLIFLQGVAQVFRCIICLTTGAWPGKLEDVEELEQVLIKEHEREAALRRAGRGGAGGTRAMTDPQVAVFMLGMFIFLISLGFPVAFTLMGMGIGFGYYAYFESARLERIVTSLAGEDPGTFDTIRAWAEALTSNRIFDLLVNQTYSVMSNDALTAVPLFLFMGYIVERSEIIGRLFATLNVATRHIPGSMAVAALVTCALFATATGIVGAVVTLMGLLAFPSMLKARYDISLASGVICAGGCLGILIPPSVMLIVYGATSGVSVVRLYAAAFLPGFLLAGLYIVYVITRASINPSLAPKPRAEDLGDTSIGFVLWSLLTSFLPLAVLILAVLGAIVLGLATPSEAAAIGALGGLLLAAAYRALTWERLKESVYLTMRTSAMVCWLFVGSFTFASVFAYLGGQTVIADFMAGLELTPLQFLILAQVIIFLLGWPLEWTEIIIIFIPIFLPLLALYDIDPLFFGILIALNLQSAFLSPPMAMSCYYLKGIAPPHVRLTQIFWGVTPYLFIIILSMIIVYVFPQIVYWLPDALYG